jgi:hypothetical protein
VAVTGCGFLVYQAVEQYGHFDVITMTKIKRETRMTLPAVTFCSSDENISEMIIDCVHGTSRKGCKMNNLELYDRYGNRSYCVQLNHGTNATELQKATGEGFRYGYNFTFYQPSSSYIERTVTDNKAQVVRKEIREYVYPGLVTYLVLSKTVQTALGPPHSNCNESTDYREVNCIKDCYIKAMAEICGCRYVSECSSYWSEECRNAYYNSSRVESKCNKECPVECNHISFPSNRVDIGLDMDNYTFNNYKSLITRKFNISEDGDDEIKKRMTQMYVYFDKFETTEITQSPSMSLTSLVANVGGLLGKSLHSLCIFNIHLTYPNALL